jgi:hypothetical protein
VARPLLSGLVPEEENPERAELRTEIRRLEADLRASRLETNAAENEAATAKTAIAALRQQLLPLHRALRAVFGEIDLVAIPESAPAGNSPSAAAPQRNPRWESWKQKMPGRPAEFIELLLLHGTMSRNQLMAAAHCGKDVVRVTISRLNVAGLITKNGSQYSLKEL